MTLVDIATSEPDVHPDMIVDHVFRAFRFKRTHRSVERTHYVLGIAAMMLRDDAKFSNAQIASKLQIDESTIDEMVINAHRMGAANAETRDKIFLVRDRVHADLESIGIFKMLSGLEEPPAPDPIAGGASMIDISKAIGKLLGVPVEKIRSHDRSASVSDARFIIFAIAKMFQPKRSLKEIAYRFDHMDHTSVLHGLQRVSEAIEAPGEPKNKKLYGKITYVCTTYALDIDALVSHRK